MGPQLKSRIWIVWSPLGQNSIQWKFPSFSPLFEVKRCYPPVRYIKPSHTSRIDPKQMKSMIYLGTLYGLEPVSKLVSVKENSNWVSMENLSFNIFAMKVMPGGGTGSQPKAGWHGLLHALQGRRNREAPRLPEFNRTAFWIFRNLNWITEEGSQMGKDVIEFHKTNTV